jgi:hypothetical protein
MKITKSVYLKNRYKPNSTARVHLYDRPRDESYKVRLKDEWAYFYNNRKLIWDCNEVFFKTHFHEVQK